MGRGLSEEGGINDQSSHRISPPRLRRNPSPLHQGSPHGSVSAGRGLQDDRIRRLSGEVADPPPRHLPQPRLTGTPMLGFGAEGGSRGDMN